VLRRLAIQASRNTRLRHLAMSTPGFRDIAWRMVAGEDLDSAARVAEELNAAGIEVTLNALGIHLTEPDLARGVADQSIATVERIRSTGLRSHLSVKPTALGIEIDEAFCREQLLRVMEVASRAGVFVRIDMEERPFVEATIRLHEEMAERFGDDAVGIVIQSYLREPPYDLAAMARRGARIRLVKGGYSEPASVVLPRAEADAAFLRDIELLLREATRPAIATHDVKAVNWTLRVARDAGLARDGFEFQMLYGVKPALGPRLAEAGYRVRYYVPFGGYWLNWLMLTVHGVVHRATSAAKRSVGRAA
jgi:proline dehydrogenase